MDTVVVLIASPDNPVLSSEVVNSARSMINGPSDPVWLNPAIACEMTCQMPDDADMRLFENNIRKGLGSAPVDIAVLPAANRKKKLLVADMDSTIIAQECLDELAAAAGIAGKVAPVTARAMAGELDFEQALRTRLMLLKGTSQTIVAKVIRDQITFTAGAVTLVQTMKANQAYTALVSGGFSHFTGYVAKMCGFDDHQANVLEIIDGVLTGAPLGPVLGQKAKKKALAQYAMMNALTFGQTLAAGDGANDIDMLKRAGIGVAFHGKPAVRDAADVRIDHGDLTALCYLQGYHRDELVTAAPRPSGPKAPAITTSKPAAN